MSLATLEQFLNLRNELDVHLNTADDTLANRLLIASKLKYGTGKNAACRSLLIMAGKIPTTAKLYVKTDICVVSQLSRDIHDNCYLLVIGTVGITLYRFDADAVRAFGRSPHGKRQVSDALRINLEEHRDLLTPVYHENYNRP